LNTASIRATSPLVAYGGAGPLHAAAVARELAICTVIIPPAPGHFSALGMLMADLCRDYVQTLFARLHTLSMEQLEAQFQELEAKGGQHSSPPGLPLTESCSSVPLTYVMWGRSMRSRSGCRRTSPTQQRARRSSGCLGDAGWAWGYR